MKITIDFNESGYIKAIADGVKVGNLDIYEDEDGTFWLNGIEVKEEYRRKGIATEMINKAIAEYGEVYISTASQTQHNDNNDNTARYLCDDGAEMVNGLVAKKILKKEWCINPFGEEEY